MPKKPHDDTLFEGINILIAFDNRQAVVDAYPNAEVTYDEDGDITMVEDSQLGIRIKWSQPVYIFPGSVSMEIYAPLAALPVVSKVNRYMAPPSMQPGPTPKALYGW